MNKLLITFAILLSLFFMGCSTSTGDSCEQESDCDSGLTCDMDFPNGYCLSYNCNLHNSESCTENAQCTYFIETEATYCLAKCNKNDDCRSGYDCTAIPNNEYRVCLPEK